MDRFPRFSCRGIMTTTAAMITAETMRAVTTMGAVMTAMAETTGAIAGATIIMTMMNSP